MADISIKCPNCGEEIPLSEGIIAQVESQLSESIAEEARVNAERALEPELARLNTELQDREDALANARNRELDLLKSQRKLQDKVEEVDLEIERRLAEERAQIEAKAAERLTEEHRLKDREKDQTIRNAQQQIDALKQQLEQRSQQAQGEAGELELEDMLIAAFPYDQIEPVGKGIRGADVVQRVCGPTGEQCGTIIWESKNTKRWNAEWLTKLKDDQIRARADVAAIVSRALPDGVSHFTQTDGVWISSLACAEGLAVALRSTLVQVARARATEVGRDEKKEILYSYLSGPEFSHRVESVVRAFIAMQKDLGRERRAMERIWSKREKQIERVVQGVAGMYGDLQGIIGHALPTIEPLELPPPSGET